MEAADDSVPLYNRISFLSIFSSNLDEFFRVRMPAIYAFEIIKGKKTTLREEYPKGLPQKVKEVVQQQLDDFGRILKHQIIPQLKDNNIHLYYGDDIQIEHQPPIRQYFLARVLSFLQPVMLTIESKQEVFLENNAIYFIVELINEKADQSHEYALLNIPSASLSRFFQLPSEDKVIHFIFLEDIIRENLSIVFPAHNVAGAWSIKLTRDAELNIGDEFHGDLGEKIEKQLEKRDIGPSTRFLFDQTMPDEMRKFLQQYFTFRDEEMVEGGRYHNLKDLGSLPDPTNGTLSYQEWKPVNHPGFRKNSSMFSAINEMEHLLHIPYHSYDGILRFFNEASIDPGVKEIYVTLYRVAAESHIANALVSAAKNGKKVVVFVELKARFDEANNLRWSKKMKAAGVRIINSLPGLKVHAKVALVKRVDIGVTKYYALLSTGNFNESTGRFYTDHVLCTADKVICTDLQLLFDYLQSHKYVSRDHHVPFRKLLVAGFNMVRRFRQLIQREIRNAKKGRPAEIIIKVNNLQEREMISLLYEASQAGVTINLLVRSICCIAPGVEGLSENIRVHRIVDRYLEHPRIFYFHNAGNPEYFMGSADWMNRNIHSRIEVCFPLKNKDLCKEIDAILRAQLSDNIKAVHFTAEMENRRMEIKGEKRRSQEEVYEMVRGIWNNE
jgi:polyphosphate kinase